MSLKSKKTWLLILLGIIVLAALAAVIYQIQRGLIVTNMRNSFSWGLYIVMWAFFVGIAAGGLVVTSVTYLFKVDRLKPFGRIASLSAFLCTLAAMTMLIPDLGRPERLWHLFRYPQFNSVLIWDVIVLSSYALFTGFYTYLQMRPDVERNGIKLPLVGTIGKRASGEVEWEANKQRSEKWSRRVAPLGLVLAVLIHTITAWVLATQLGRGWWFGGALAPTFIASAITSGPSLVILASLYVLGFRPDLKQAYQMMGKIAAAGAIILLFIYFNDFVVKAWWGSGPEFEGLQVMFRHYWPLHLTEVLLIVMGVYWMLKRAGTLRGLVAGSLMMCVGVLVHRFLLLPSAFNVIPFRVPVAENGGLTEWPFPIAVGEITAGLGSPAPTFVSWWNYIPSPIEITIALGFIAGLMLVFVALSQILPVRVVKNAAHL